ncbi:MarR family winged helix-turn-helix transcriptional regulator [Paenibacillus sp. L3-i20]|uniref:MarR family winged helix-turn-helix transcriptional regulator n=1 Tax=Paenibacillus sp. L3-i20 TaxID=2905833 RepID=UPI001EDF6098|nr:MarR family transcriptional regulator [Paenibacillus sp. L3-i20]GKU80033.1 MarR family transcriptional regulator [Paenibacillus sp. L3-i20]
MALSHYEFDRFRHSLIAAQRLGSRQISEYMKAIDLTPSQSEVIQVLKRWQPLSLKDLGTLLVCEKDSPSRLIERLVKDGLIDKVMNPADARFVLLQLTDLGQEKSLQIEEIEEKLRGNLEKVFNDEELSLMSSTLEKMLVHFPDAETLRKRGLMK